MAYVLHLIIRLCHMDIIYSFYIAYMYIMSDFNRLPQSMTNHG